MSGTTHDKQTQHHELTAGLVLLVSAIIALLFANIPSTASLYKAIIHHNSGYELFHHPIGARFWVNEVAMCVFFFNIGLELKYHLVNGALKNRRVAAMPFLGAIGGMLVPAACFIIFNNTPSELRGWAIPTATDIAFAIGALSLVKRHVPDGLKSFLLALAIFDDIGAILIIALFYSHSINPIGMLFTVVICGLLAVLNRRKVDAISVYVLYGCFLWAALLVTGIHTTLAGVVAGVSIPIVTTKNGRKTYGMDNNVYRLAHGLSPYVNFIILPIFAFFNAGTQIMSADSIFHPIGVGIMTGLVIGKPLGIISFCYIGQNLKLCRLPDRTTWQHIAGVASLCGIGFTMSLFIGKLAYYKANISYMAIVKKSVLTGSLLSGMLGLYYLKTHTKCLKPMHTKGQ